MNEEPILYWSDQEIILWIQEESKWKSEPIYSASELNEHFKDCSKKCRKSLKMIVNTKSIFKYRNKLDFWFNHTIRKECSEYQKDYGLPTKLRFVYKKGKQVGALIAAYDHTRVQSFYQDLIAQSIQISSVILFPELIGIRYALVKEPLLFLWENEQFYFVLYMKDGLILNCTSYDKKKDILAEINDYLILYCEGNLHHIFLSDQINATIKEALASTEMEISTFAIDDIVRAYP